MKGKRAVPRPRDTKAVKEAERESRIIDCWMDRPKDRRTADDLMAFYGWLSDHKSELLPRGDGGYARLRVLLAPHILDRS